MAKTFTVEEAAVAFPRPMLLPEKLTLEQALAAFPCLICSRPGRPSVGVLVDHGRWVPCFDCRGDRGLQVMDVWRDTPPSSEAAAVAVIGPPLPARYITVQALNSTAPGWGTFDRGTGSIADSPLPANFRNETYVMVCRAWTFQSSVTRVRERMHDLGIGELHVQVGCDEFDDDGWVLVRHVRIDGRLRRWEHLPAAFAIAITACRIGLGGMFSGAGTAWLTIDAAGVGLRKR